MARLPHTKLWWAQRPSSQSQRSTRNRRKGGPDWALGRPSDIRSSLAQASPGSVPASLTSSSPLPLPVAGSLPLHSFGCFLFANRASWSVCFGHLKTLLSITTTFIDIALSVNDNSNPHSLDIEPARWTRLLRIIEPRSRRTDSQHLPFLFSTAHKYQAFSSRSNTETAAYSVDHIIGDLIVDRRTIGAFGGNLSLASQSATSGISASTPGNERLLCFPYLVDPPWATQQCESREDQIGILIHPPASTRRRTRPSGFVLFNFLFTVTLFPGTTTERCRRRMQGVISSFDDVGTVDTIAGEERLVRTAGREHL